MTRRALPIVAAVSALLAAWGCGGVSLEERRQEDVVVLVADPEEGGVGSASVQGQGAEVLLTEDRSSTRIRSGQSPAVPVLVSDAEIQRRFGGAMAARPPQPRHFILYFETAREQLTVESAAGLQEIVDVVRTRPSPDVSVTGHTDTTDTAQANLALGLRRASMVRDRLLDAGLLAALIEIASHGEADLLVPTADNVPEARNRRVEVTVR